MSKTTFYKLAIITSVFGGLVLSSWLPKPAAFTLLATEDFETEGEGSRYRSNNFNDGTNDYWTRAQNNVSGPNGSTDGPYSNIQGNSWWSGQDIDASENPLSTSDDGYLMLRTLDVSAYRGGTIEVKVYLGANTVQANRYEVDDYLQLRYAYDTDIATGANGLNSLPSIDNISSGTYTTFGAYYGTGDNIMTNTGSTLIRDTDLNGAANLPASTNGLSNSLKEQTFTFDVGATSTHLSILLQVATNAGTEEIAIDQISVSAESGASSAPTSAVVGAIIFLEGAYNGSVMSTTINGSIPSVQPYSGATFNNHAGTESASAPAGAVDWVLVELREASTPAAANNAAKVGSAAGFLMSDGSIKSTDGTSDLTISLSGNTGADFYVVVYHRNHLPIMSATAIVESSGIYTIDFTSSAASTHQGVSALASLAGGKFGMIAGDQNSDGQVNTTDLTNWRSQNGGSFTYIGSSADFNLDGQVNAVDRNEYQQPNSGKSSQVPTN